LSHTHEKRESVLFSGRKTVEVVRVVHEKVFFAVLVQEKDDVVFQGRCREEAKQVRPDPACQALVVQ
jgi:hypothetical protein